MDNLREAYCKARRGKLYNKEVLQFSANLNDNLLQLRQQLLSGDIITGGYRKFTIYDPKERIIIAAPFHQRVLHHGLLNICHQYFEKFQIFNSYASRQGKGTYAALEKAATYSKKYPWFLKLDCRKYFDIINHGILKTQLQRLFKEGKLLHIFDRIIDSYHTEEGCGLPIGNLTSQYFANHYLSVADHFALEKLGVPGFVRYMDDMVLWDNDINKLLHAGNTF